MGLPTVFVPFPMLPLEAMPEELAKQSTTDLLVQAGAFSHDENDGDIGPLMESLAISAMAGTDFHPPVTTPQKRNVTKLAAPAPTSWVPEITIAPATGATFAKRASIPFSSQKAARREKIPANPSGFWVRDFDENENLFRCFYSADGEEETWGVAL